MNSGWYVGTDYTDTKKGYTVWRELGIDQDIHVGREVYGKYDTRDEAVRVAKDLNKRAAEEFWKR